MNNWKTLGLLLLPALMAYGCAGAGERSSPDEVQAFFGAANQANYLGVMCMSPQNVDLSAYNSFMGVKYPPTDSVEVLSEPPSRPYQAFAVLRGAVAPATASQSVAPADLAQFTAKAKSIGADAIIICHRGEPGQTTTGQSVRVEAVAIKYRIENPEEKKGRL